MKLSFLKDKTYLKESLIIAGWICGLIILSGLCWYFTHPVRNRIQINSINQVLEQSGNPGRIIERIQGRNRAGGLGSYYTFTGNSSAFVFTFIGEGAFFPCAAILAADGEVVEIIPLNRSGQRFMERASPQVINIYLNRIMGGS